METRKIIDFAYPDRKPGYFEGRLVQKTQIVKDRDHPKIAYWVWSLTNLPGDTTSKTFVALVDNVTSTTDHYGIFNLRFNDAVQKCQIRLRETLHNEDCRQLAFLFEDYDHESQRYIA